MMYIVLRFIGAIIAAVIFSFLAEAIHILFFGGAAHFFANFSWSNWLGFDTFRGFLLPIAWAVLWLVGMGLQWLVRGSKKIAAIPVLYFLLRIIYVFYLLFIETAEPVVNEIGAGFWYYVGAIVTYFFIIVCYVVCTAAMLTNNEE